MRQRAGAHHRLRPRATAAGFGAAVVALPLAAVTLAALPGTALADPVTDARQRAAQLRTEVADLTARAEVASEAYAGAQEQLQLVVSRRISADEAAARAGVALDDRRAQAGSRIRALYRAGGQLGLLTSVLRAPTIGDALDRLHAVQHVLRTDAAAVASAGGAEREAARDGSALDRAARAQLGLEQAVATRATQVQSLLGQAQAVLDGADARVRALVAQQQAQAEAAAAARARAALATTGSRAASATALAALAAARTQLGKPYQWGGTGPASWDCSGLTQWAYAQAGVRLPRTAAEQWSSGPVVALADLAPGDLLFWATDPQDLATIHHVAIYAGGGLMVAAPHTGAFVQVQPVYLDGFVGAVRPGG